MSNKSNLTVNETDTQQSQLGNVELESAKKPIKADSADKNTTATSNAKSRSTGKQPSNDLSKADGGESKKKIKAKVTTTKADTTNIESSATVNIDNNEKSSVADNNTKISVSPDANPMKNENNRDSLVSNEIDSESPEPIIIAGGASEYVFEPEQEDEPIIENDTLEEAEGSNPKEKSLRIIEGGGKEIVIDDAPSISEQSRVTPTCTRNKIKDKKIGDIGTYVAIAFFVITIIISLFNIKGMRYPLSCLFLSLAALSMGVTTILRMLNNKKCDCVTCKTQNKTFLYSSVLWFLVFLGALIAFLVLILK